MPFGFGLGKDGRTPGFNPNAPLPGVGRTTSPLGIALPGAGGALPRDPGIGGGVPQGPRLPQLGAQPQPAPAASPQPTGGPGDLSQLGGLQRGLLGAGDVAAAVRGRPLPSQQLSQQRIAEYQRQRTELLQNLQLTSQFGDALAKTPVDQLEARRAKLRTAYGAIAPGQEALYDALTEDAGLSKAATETLQQNEAVKLMLATGATTEDIAEYVRSPAFKLEAQQTNDRTALPQVKRKLDALRNSTDPKVRARVDAIAKDGLATVEEYIALSDELGTDGPEGTKLTPGESDAARRNQQILIQQVPGLTSTDDYVAEQELQRKIRLEHEKVKGDTSAANKQESILQRQVLFEAYKQGNKDIESAENSLMNLSQIDQTLAAAEKVIEDGKARTGFIAGRNVPLAAQKVFNEQELNVLEQAFGNQFVQSVESLRGLGQMSDKDAAALQQTIGSVTKDEAFNLSDLKRRRAILNQTLVTKREQRRIAVSNRENIADKAGLGDVLETKGTANVEAPASGPKPKGKPTQADVDRVARETGTNDATAIRAALKSEGYEF